MKKHTLAFLVLSLVAIAAAAAQSPAQRLLTDGDVKKFVRDFKSMTAELERLGQQPAPDLENPAGLAGALAAMQASADVQGVLRKYGWGDAFFQKFSTVFVSYLALKLAQARTEAGASVEAQLKELDANPQLTSDQKAAFKAQLGGLVQAMAQAESSYRNQVHPDDLKVVEANEAGLDALFDK